MAGPEIAMALWLLPDGDAATYFRETIARLAQEHDGPLFAPHLTLGLGPAALLEKIRAKPLELAIVGLDCSTRFTKTLFVRFALSPALAQLRDSLGMEAAEYDPHLSLLYADMPMAQKNLLRDTLPPFPFTRVRFATAAAVRCQLPITTAADVSAWKTIRRRSLAPPE